MLKQQIFKSFNTNLITLIQDEKMMTTSVTQNKLAPLVATESHDDVTEDDDVIRPIDKNDVDW